jgi:hypothetical protein
MRNQPIRAKRLLVKEDRMAEILVNVAAVALFARLAGSIPSSSINPVRSCYTETVTQLPRFLHLPAACDVRAQLVFVSHGRQNRRDCRESEFGRSGFHAPEVRSSEPTNAAAHDYQIVDFLGVEWHGIFGKLAVSHTVRLLRNEPSWLPRSPVSSGG